MLLVKLKIRCSKFIEIAEKIDLSVKLGMFVKFGSLEAG